MCTTEQAVKGVIGAIIAAAGLWVFISGLVLQWTTVDTAYTNLTTQILLRYIVGIILIGGTKMMIFKTMMKSHPMPKARSSKRRRR